MARETKEKGVVCVCVCVCDVSLIVSVMLEVLECMFERVCVKCYLLSVIISGVDDDNNIFTEWTTYG